MQKQEGFARQSDNGILFSHWQLRLPIGLFIVVGILYLICYWHQSGVVKRDASFQYRETISVPDQMNLLTLDITYPKTLWLDSVRSDSQNVIMRLQSTVAATQTQSYIVNIGFTSLTTAVMTLDQQRSPIVPEFVLTPTSELPAFAIFKMQRTLIPDNEPLQITPTLSLKSRDGTDFLLEKQLLQPIDIQSIKEARLQYFLSLLLSPATVTASILALAVKMFEDATRTTKEINTALSEIHSWSSVFQNDVSEGARRYLDDFTKREDLVWKDKIIQRTLEKTWKEHAPLFLQYAVELLSYFSNNENVDVDSFIHTVNSIDREQTILSLRWAYEHMDDEWKEKVVRALIFLDEHSLSRESMKRNIPDAMWMEIQQSSWSNILRIWPHISFWRDIHPIVDCEVEAGLRFLGLNCNPFGSIMAENDPLLFESRIDPDWIKEVDGSYPFFVVGPSGSGKSAAALFLTYDNLQRGDYFPVYCPLKIVDLNLDYVARIIAHSLLNYIGMVPETFMKCGVTKRSAIAHLISYYTDSDLLFYFHQAGLSTVGEGGKILDEIRALAQDVSVKAQLTDYQLLLLLDRAKLYNSNCTKVFLDIYKCKNAIEDLSIKNLVELSETLLEIGIIVKAFLPEVYWSSLRRFRGLKFMIGPDQLVWSNEQLATLLYKRFAKQNTLSGWCTPDGKALFPEISLIHAANGSPGSLICKGNTLLKCIGKEQCRLTDENLQTILGPLPESPTEILGPLPEDLKEVFTQSSVKR